MRHSPDFCFLPWNTRKKLVCVKMAVGNAALHFGCISQAIFCRILFWERENRFWIQ